MVDTQWPRYMIFLQVKENQPFQHAGTVHAVDEETAIQNGRDIYGRRPKTVRLMAVLDANILSKSKEELAISAAEKIKGVESEEAIQYFVFARENHQGQCVELGEVSASSHEEAMQIAIEMFSNKTRYLWWVFPVADASYSASDESEILFDPFLQHSFKEASDYPVVTMMRKIKKGKGNNDG